MKTVLIFAALAVVAFASMSRTPTETGGSTAPASPSGALHAQTSTAPPGSAPARVNPLHDPRGIHPGLTPVPSTQLARARALIQRVRTAPAGLQAGYRRDRFGVAWTDDTTDTWGHNGCKTREDILRRDLRGIEYRAGTNDCVVLTGILQEPYAPKFVEFSKARPLEVQIDHVMPLSYDWKQGASGWTLERRKQIANDPLNLLAVDGPLNQAKSDSGPADWMPPNAAVRCAYSVRFAQVSRRYRLPVRPQDKTTMLGACSS
jgi:hypothetical protein